MEEGPETMMAIEEENQDIGSLTLSLFQSSERKRDRHLCSVVTTVAQELKDQGYPLTPVAYFGATFSTLKRLCQDPSCGQDPAFEALLTFLSMVMPAVSPAAVRSRGEAVGDVMVMVMEMETVSDSAVKAAMKCVSQLIVNWDKAGWSQVEPLYKFLLGFITDKREKVRMQAHSCLRDVLQSFEGAHLLSASEEIVGIFLEFLSVASQSSATGTAAAPETRGVWEVLFVLNALRGSLPLMSSKSRIKVLKYLKSLVTLHQSIVTRAIVEILHALCCSSTSDVPDEILLDLLCFFASTVTDKEKSADSMASTARLLHVGIKKAYDVNWSICTVKLPLVFSVLGEILACEHEEAIFAAMEAFKGLICTCIDKNLIDQGVDQIKLSQSGVTRPAPTSIEKICATVEGLLGYQYIEVWDLSFQIISTMFDRLGESSFYLMAGAIKSLANLEKLPDEELAYRKQLHECIGSGISVLGPEMFLNILPLNLEGNDLSETNVWLLPILKQYTVSAKLSFFKNSILIMIDQMQQRSQELESQGLIVSARITKGIVYSLWSLLPSFCNYPLDTASCFKDLQKELCDTLIKEPDLRGLICSSLQTLIQQNKKILEANDDASVELSIHEQKAKDHYTTQIAEQNLSVMRAFAKQNLKDRSRTISKEAGSSCNLITVLSEIFLDSSKDSGCLQSTIHEYASVLDKKDVKYFFKKIMNQLLGATEEAVAHKKGVLGSMQIDGSSGENSVSIRRALLLDLAVSFLPGLGIDEVNFLLSYCIKPGVQDEEGIIQKKAYKSLSIILKEREEFLSNNLHGILELMVEVLPSCHFSAKRYRLDSLYFIIVHLSKYSSEQLKHEIIGSFLTEIILALKEDNKKTRNRAYELLVKIGHACEDEKHGGKKENLRMLFKLVVGVLGGKTPHVVSAAAKGLARLAYEFSDLITEAYKLLPSAVILLKRQNREICKASLGFMKVLVAKSQVDCLHMHLKEIVEGLLAWQDDTRKHFKAKVKLLLEMLIKKCGLDAVKVFMPEEHMKLLNNIRKITDRKERKNKSEKDTRSVHSKTSSRHSRWNHTSIFSDVEDEDGDDGSDAGYLYSNVVSGSQNKTLSKASSLRSKKTCRSSKRLPGDTFDQLEDDPLDLLDGQRTRASLKSSSHLKWKAESDDEPEINPGGRLVIYEGGRKAKRERSHPSEYGFDMKSNSASQHSLTKAQRKRHRSDSGWAYTGSDYTSKKASGDLKRKNKFEPYAYWPLDRKLLNQREENKAIARKGMASVVKVTKKLEGKSASAALSVGGLKIKTHKRHIKKHK